jgi:hypothetical protein
VDYVQGQDRHMLPPLSTEGAHGDGRAGAWYSGEKGCVAA